MALRRRNVLWEHSAPLEYLDCHKGEHDQANDSTNLRLQFYNSRTPRDVIALRSKVPYGSLLRITIVSLGRCPACDGLPPKNCPWIVGLYRVS